MVIFIRMRINPHLDPGTGPPPSCIGQRVDQRLGHGQNQRQGLRPGLGLGMA